MDEKEYISDLWLLFVRSLKTEIYRDYIAYSLALEKT